MRRGIMVPAHPAGAPQRGKATARLRPERRTQHNRQHNRKDHSAKTQRCAPKMRVNWNIDAAG